MICPVNYNYSKCPNKKNGADCFTCKYRLSETKSTIKDIFRMLNRVLTNRRLPDGK